MSESVETMQPVTAIHGLVERCRAADYLPLVAKMRSGWVVMGERQVLLGYCLLLPDPVVPQLNALAGRERVQFLDDMASLGDALLSVTGAVRMNYALFGNVEPALHAHVFPRYVDEPTQSRTAQPWALDWGAAPQYAESVHGDLKRRVAARLGALATAGVSVTATLGT